MTNDTLDVLWNVCDAPPVNVSWCLADSDQEDLSHNSGLMNIRKPLGKYFHWFEDFHYFHYFHYFCLHLDIRQCRSFLIEIIPKLFKRRLLNALLIFHALIFRYHLIFLSTFILLISQIKLYISSYSYLTFLSSS